MHPWELFNYTLFYYLLFNFRKKINKLTTSHNSAIIHSFVFGLNACSLLNINIPSIDFPGQVINLNFLWPMKQQQITILPNIVNPNMHIPKKQKNSLKENGSIRWYICLSSIHFP